MASSTGGSHGTNLGVGGGGGSNFGASNTGFGGSMVSVGGSGSNTSQGGSSGEINSHSFESRIDKMRRFISSPLTRRKSTSQASTESSPPLLTSASKQHSDSHQHHHQKIFGTPIEKLTHQRSFNEMSSSSICSSSSSGCGSSFTASSSTHLSASLYSTMRSMSTSGLPGSLFCSSSASSSPSSSTINLAPGNTTPNQGTSSSSITTSIPSNLPSRKANYDAEITVPFVISRLCHYIEDSQGLMQEGLFRTSGNARLIEKLKISFDSNGDAPLETEGDIPSAAALLKLFLRELPVPLIPQSIHSLFLDTVQDTLNHGNSYNKDAFIGRIKTLVENLPDENYYLLKYLSRFLHQVARNEPHNRMNPASLGIIFGPNIFRVAAEDYKGLREQSLTNQVVTFFITDYETIFGNDLSPELETSGEVNLITSGAVDSGIGLALSADPLSTSSSPSESKVPEIDSTVRKDPTRITSSGSPLKPGETIIVSIDCHQDSQSAALHHHQKLDKDSSPELSSIGEKMKKQGIDGNDHPLEEDSKEMENVTPSDSNYTPLRIDLPPIDCDPSDSSSISPTLACSSISPCPIDSKDYLLTLYSATSSTSQAINSPSSTETSPSLTPSRSLSIEPSPSPCSQAPLGKRKDRKYILSSSSSPTVRSSSEERKPNFSSTSRTEELISQSTQEVRRCNSYQDVTSGGPSTPHSRHSSHPFPHQHHASPRQLIKSINLSTDSVTQSPEAKRREIDSSPSTNPEIVDNKSKGKLSRSTQSFDSRPSSLDLNGNQKSANITSQSKSEPTIRGKPCSSESSESNHHRHYQHHQPLILTSSSTCYSKDSDSGKSDAPHASCGLQPTAKPHSHRQQSSLSNPPIVTVKASSSSSYSALPHIDLNTLHKNGEGESAMVSDLRYSWSSINDSESMESLLGEEIGIVVSEENPDEGKEGSESLAWAGDEDTSETQSDPRLLDAKGSSEPVPNVAVQMLRRRNAYEAPLSPSAYRGFLGQRAPHLDHTIPPSPPGEQEHRFHGNKTGYSNESTLVKEAKRKVHNLKRRLKQFERDFEKENGYRPSHEQKMKSDVAQPLLFELNKYRKMLRECKDDARVTIEFYEGVFNEMQRSLKERRYCVGRPETIEEMSTDQIVDEKLDLQKSLLKYESVFGRPSRREDRVIMKPLYDRYRTIRNLVAKMPKKESNDLQPILEHVAMNFTSPSHSPAGSMEVREEEEDEEDEDTEDPSTSDLNIVDDNQSKLILEKEIDRENDSNKANHNSNNNKKLNYNNKMMKGDNGNDDQLNDSNNKNLSKLDLRDRNNNKFDGSSFKLTRYAARGVNLSSIQLSETINSLTLNQPTSIATATMTTASSSSTSGTRNLWHNLHELPPGELFKELALVRREKTELRKIIRSFEEEFHRAHGRKVSELEKTQLESVYTNYKACKKKLRLLEVFIEKHEKRRMDS